MSRGRRNQDAKLPPFPNTDTGGCGKGPQPADMAEDDDPEAGRPAPTRRRSSKSNKPAAVPASSAPEAVAAGGDMKESQ